MSWPHSRSRRGAVGDRLLDVGDELVRLAEREQRVEAILGDVHAQLVERTRGQVAQRSISSRPSYGVPLPRRERLVERVDRGSRVALLEQRPARARRGRRTRMRRPDRARRRGHRRALRDHEPPSPDRDSGRPRVGARRCRSGSVRVALRGGLSPPDRVDQGVDGDGGALGREERAEDGTLLRAAERHVVDRPSASRSRPNTEKCGAPSSGRRRVSSSSHTSVHEASGPARPFRSRAVSGSEAVRAA